MSPLVLDTFDPQKAQELMGKENYGQSPGVQATVSIDGRRFSDVTNTIHISSRRKNPEDFHLAHFYNKDNSEHLHQEIAYLKNLLAEKEATLESTKQELQKALYYSYKSSQQNKQLAQTNSQMFAELCMLREKLKLLQHEYNQMSVVFRVKREELEQTVRDLSEQLQKEQQNTTKQAVSDLLEQQQKVQQDVTKQIVSNLSEQLKKEQQNVTKDPGHTENRLQSAQLLPSIENQNFSGETPGAMSNGDANSSRTILSTEEGKKNAKRGFAKGRLTSNGRSNLMTRHRKEGKAVSMATLNQTDQSHAISSQRVNLEEVFAGDTCNGVQSLLRANGSAKEETSDGKRTCIRRQLTNVSFKESPLHKKVRQEQQAVPTSTLDQIAHCGAALSTLKTLEEFCTGGNASINEETSNGKRIALRRRYTNVSYKEPPLNTKLRRSDPPLSTQKQFGSEKHNTSLDVSEPLEKVSKGDISNEAGNSETNVLENEEKKAGKRVCSRQSSVNKDSNMKTKLKQEEQGVPTPSFSGLQSLNKVGEDHDLGFDVPYSQAAHGDLRENSRGHKNCNFTTAGDITCKATRVEKKQVHETAPCHALTLNGDEATKLGLQTERPDSKAVECGAYNKEVPLHKVGDLEGTGVRLRTGRSDMKAVESVAFEKEVPLHKVGKVQELHSDVPQFEAAHFDLLETSQYPQDCALSTAEGITNKAIGVQQFLHVHSSAPCQTSSLNTSLDESELRRSSTGRPVRKAVVTVASYKEIPLNIKMRRSQ